ncbi:hypothetical protein N658DRAFT_239858 [Parathielavia hyrcaniae]|uniref:Uncharacterized protein n=1 Tax=Parathielavia hyrcaniae TaxID=113614 RepID=A0AAN6Q5N0_9PEZI|nr:hypothetical protein N658DRAFT_239858 [Parathielavia hyrcaniae]
MRGQRDSRKWPCTYISSGPAVFEQYNGLLTLSHLVALQLVCLPLGSHPILSSRIIMGLYNKLPDDVYEVDVVIIGATNSSVCRRHNRLRRGLASGGGRPRHVHSRHRRGPEQRQQPHHRASRLLPSPSRARQHGERLLQGQEVLRRGRPRAHPGIRACPRRRIVDQLHDVRPRPKVRL